MKATREKESFKPVTIVLETQDELDWLFCCLAGTSINAANKTYADEVGNTTHRFDSFAGDIDMYEAIKNLL